MLIKIVILACLPICFGVANNVCKNFDDYPHTVGNPNCWFNPDLNSSPENIANRHGYHFEYHSLMTVDGYNITLFRIQDKIAKNKQPVLLHHGITSNGLCFMTAGNRSLGFYLAKRGFDVWLANARGSPYSQGHRTLSTKDPKYWNFSFHEMAMFDVPGTIDYIMGEIGNSKRIIYVGHSMGSTVSFVYASLMKEHAERSIKGIIAFCPVASLKFIKSPLIHLVPLTRAIVDTLLAKGKFAMFESRDLRDLIYKICVLTPAVSVCKLLIFAIVGEDHGELLPEDLPLVLSVQPTSTSVKTVAHFVQMAMAKRFQHFDYGLKGNAGMYGSASPPPYELGNVSVPVHLFFGESDSFSDKKGARLIYDQLKTPDKSITHISHDGKVPYNHMDFLYGKNMVKYLYAPVMEKIEQFKNAD